MNNLILFFIFFVLGFISQFLTTMFLYPLKLIKLKIIRYIIDFFYVCCLAITLQLFVTKLNYGEFRAFFTISYLLGIYISIKLNKIVLDKFFLSLYNKVIKGRNKCKQTKS